jgi:serine/threonine-protein kinase
MTLGLGAAPPPGPHGTPREPAEGDLLAGRYLVERTLGRGGFGVVFQARDQGTQRTVALKVLLATSARKAPKAVERFRREAVLSASLSYPNTVRVFDYGETEDGVFYLVMEFLDGTPLSTLLRRGTLDERRALHVARQILCSLTEAHDAGIVHRDIKPENVMLLPLRFDPDFVKVMDFGIAKMSTGVGPQITQAGQTFGTPRYMAPEQLQGGQLSPSTDLYAVGLLLYEMLCGRPAIKADSLAETVSEVIFGEPFALPEEVRASAACRALILKAADRAPQRRFQSATEFLAALDKLEGRAAPSAQPALSPAPVEPAPSGADKASEPTMLFSAAPDAPAPKPAATQRITERAPMAPLVPDPPKEKAGPGLWRVGCLVFAGLFVVALVAAIAGPWYVAQRLQAEVPPPKAKPSKPATRSNSGAKGER